MTIHDVSWHFFIKIKNLIFVAKTHSYGIFVAKIYDYTLIDTFWGSAGFLDSPTSYATLYLSFGHRKCRNWEAHNYALVATTTCILLQMAISEFENHKNLHLCLYDILIPFIEILAQMLVYDSWPSMLKSLFLIFPLTNQNLPQLTWWVVLPEKKCLKRTEK